MTSYTPTSSLPYPVMSDPPNAPDQIRQLALALEPRLINRYRDASARNAAITNPTLGMMTFRDDVKQYEYWDGSVWQGATQNLAVASTNSVSTSTAKSFTTDQSSALVKSSVKLVNPSALYRMLYTAHFDFNAQMTFTVTGLYALVRAFTQQGDATAISRDWANYSSDKNTLLKISGSMPMITGYLAPGANVTVSTWMQIEKANSTAGTITLSGASTTVTLTGWTTV
jgi:hypothetical protein